VISSSGLVTVSGVAPGVSSTVTITTSRDGYTSGEATSLSIAALSTGLTPTFSGSAQTSDGFTLQISNYDASFAWVGSSSSSGTVVISSSGLVTVSGVAPGVSSTVTITTSRDGYTSGEATSLSVAKIYSLKAGEVAVKSTLLTQAKLKAPSGSRYVLSVAVSSKKICKVVGTSIKTLKKGTCAVKVNVTLKGKKPVAKTVKITVR
jgi:hypothetical protein